MSVVQIRERPPIVDSFLASQSCEPLVFLNIVEYLEPNSYLELERFSIALERDTRVSHSPGARKNGNLNTLRRILNKEVEKRFEKAYAHMDNTHASLSRILCTALSTRDIRLLRRATEGRSLSHKDIHRTIWAVARNYEFNAGMQFDIRALDFWLSQIRGSEQRYALERVIDMTDNVVNSEAGRYALELVLAMTIGSQPEVAKYAKERLKRVEEHRETVLNPIISFLKTIFSPKKD